MLRSREEQALIDEATALFLGQPRADPASAKKLAKELMDQAKRILRETGDSGRDYGDRLLSRESQDPDVAAFLSLLRQEGCTDGDIRAWYNLSALERKFTEIFDNHQRFTIYRNARLGAIDREEATQRVRIACAMYSDPPYDPDEYEGNKLLPYALKARVEGWIGRRMEEDADAFRGAVEGSGGLNRLFRKDMAKGRA